jgi:hypothetical protein
LIHLAAHPRTDKNAPARHPITKAVIGQSGRVGGSFDDEFASALRLKLEQPAFCLLVITFVSADSGLLAPGKVERVTRRKSE